jgi:hypothetical protein
MVALLAISTLIPVDTHICIDRIARDNVFKDEHWHAPRESV